MTTTLLPEPLSPVAPSPVAKAKRKNWTQMEAAAFVRSFDQCAAGNAETIKYPERFTPEEAQAKLVALGVVKREPTRPALPAPHMDVIDEFTRVVGTLDESYRTLGVRYAIKSLQALLPKRPAKSE